MTAQCEGMGEVGLVRYEPALLPPCPSIRALSYSNCQRSPIPTYGLGSVSVNHSNSIKSLDTSLLCSPINYNSYWLITSKLRFWLPDQYTTLQSKLQYQSINITNSSTQPSVSQATWVLSKEFAWCSAQKSTMNDTVLFPPCQRFGDIWYLLQVIGQDLYWTWGGLILWFFCLLALGFH